MPLPSKATVSEITISREGASPSLATVATFAEANALLRDWVDTSPKGDGYGETAIVVRWKNSGWFQLRLFLEYPVPLPKIDIRQNIEYLISFALGEGTNPSWTPEENAAALARERNSGAAEHCRLVRETCLIDDRLH